MQITIGVDPDAENYGVAIYQGKQLVELHKWNLVNTIQWIMDYPCFRYPPNSLLFSIEDVCANNFIYGRNECRSPKKMAEKGRCLGKVQQSQIELMRVLDWMNVEYKLVKPFKGNWSKDKAMFERITGWSGKSNADTRSAAHIGFLAIR